MRKLNGEPLPIALGDVGVESVSRCLYIKSRLQMMNPPCNDFWQKNARRAVGAYLYIINKHHDFNREVDQFDLDSTIYVPADALYMFLNYNITEQVRKYWTDGENNLIIVVIAQDTGDYFILYTTPKSTQQG